MKTIFRNMECILHNPEILINNHDSSIKNIRDRLDLTVHHGAIRPVQIPRPRQLVAQNLALILNLRHPRLNLILTHRSDRRMGAQNHRNQTKQHKKNHNRYFQAHRHPSFDCKRELPFLLYLIHCSLTLLLSPIF